MNLELLIELVRDQECLYALSHKKYDYFIIIIIFIIDPRTVLRYITYNRVLKNSKIRIRSGFRLRAL
jgi:hypothetical protein